MPTSLTDNLPDVLKTVRTRPLFVMRLDVRKLQVIGATPGSYRRIGVVPGVSQDLAPAFIGHLGAQRPLEEPPPLWKRTSPNCIPSVFRSVYGQRISRDA
jgi:hypothetical protein